MRRRRLRLVEEDDAERLDEPFSVRDLVALQVIEERVGEGELSRRRGHDVHRAHSDRENAKADPLSARDPLGAHFSIHRD